ncbi:MAG: UpxY family transcription antiterminator [Prevotellaceae bacterium]|nr:UpxY family transcription antiterminator [Prevotellaceae bacterium]
MKTEAKDINENKKMQEEQEWFALKASRKEAKAAEVLEAAGLRVYAPQVEADMTYRGKKKIVARPLIPNTLFAYTSFHVLNVIKQDYPFITYCYKKVEGKFKILKIPAREMERFIDSSTKMKDDIAYFQPNEIELKKGDRVRIVGGVFDGYEGTLLKAKGRAKRMFVINFELLGSLGTHIEPEYIQLLK